MKRRNVIQLPARTAPKQGANRQCIVRNMTFAVDRERGGLRISVADAKGAAQQAAARGASVPDADQS